jgi:tRNA(fMet)-specific endonuclease VapC
MLTIPVTPHTACHYGFLKANIFRLHPPHSTRQNHPERCIDRVTGAELGIDENDLWIAAQAIERNLILVTNDEMLRIREVAGGLLDVEDWTRPYN